MLGLESAKFRDDFSESGRLFVATQGESNWYNRRASMSIVLIVRLSHARGSTLRSRALTPFAKPSKLGSCLTLASVRPISPRSLKPTETCVFSQPNQDRIPSSHLRSGSALLREGP
jgi:hypothetical protein